MVETKTFIPECSEFVNKNNKSLDILISIQDKIDNTKLEIKNNADIKIVRIFEYDDSDYNYVDEIIFDNWDFLDTLEREAITLILNQLPEYAYLSISDEYINICYKNSSRNNFTLFICNYQMEFDENSTKAYCESINDDWNILIYYMPRG